MCLFYDEDYEEVMRWLVGSLKDMGSWRDDWVVPSTSAITQARQRLKADSLRVLSSGSLFRWPDGERREPGSDHGG